MKYKDTSGFNPSYLRFDLTEENHMFDLIIFGKGQEKPTKNLEDENIQYIEIENRYWRYWEFITSQEGIWYSLYANDEEYAGTQICEHISYDIKDKISEINSRVNYCTLMKINCNFVSSLRTIMEKVILDSPEKTIYFLASYQSYEIEVVKGIYTLEEFFKALSHNQIYANICYVINDL